MKCLPRLQNKSGHLVVDLRTGTKKLAENGNPLKPAQIREIGETASGGDFAEDEEFRLYLDDGTFVGIYQYRPSQNLTRPVKLFLERT